MTDLKRLLADNPEVAAQPAALLGIIGAAEEAHEEYGNEDDYPDPLKKFLLRATEIAVAFIDKLELDK